MSNKIKPNHRISVKANYYGNSSKSFWSIVNAIKKDSDRQEIYSLGVALQNMEEYVLRRLHSIKKSNVRGKVFKTDVDVVKKVKCTNCHKNVDMVSSGEFCPNCYC